MPKATTFKIIISKSMSGEFGIVYKSLLKKRFNENVTETVAVKTLKGKIIIHNFRNAI